MYVCMMYGVWCMVYPCIGKVALSAVRLKIHREGGDGSRTICGYVLGISDMLIAFSSFFLLPSFFFSLIPSPFSLVSVRPSVDCELLVLLFVIVSFPASVIFIMIYYDLIRILPLPPPFRRLIAGRVYMPYLRVRTWHFSPSPCFMIALFRY